MQPSTLRGAKMLGKREIIAKIVKAVAIILLAVIWIWTLYPAPDQPIAWDQTIPNAMAQKGIQIYKMDGFNNIQRSTRFDSTEMEFNANAAEFIRNATTGVVLSRLIDKESNILREFSFLPANNTQKAYRYVETYEPPPSPFSYGVKEDGSGYHFGKNYFLVIFAIILTFMAYVSSRKDCGC